MTRASSWIALLAACTTLSFYPPPARAQLQSLVFQVGARTGLGPERVPQGRSERGFGDIEYHAQLLSRVGLASMRGHGGPLVSLRWDGFEPNDLPGFPWTLEAHVGFWQALRIYFEPGMQESSLTDVQVRQGDLCDPDIGCYGHYTSRTTTSTTRRWWDPGGWAGRMIDAYVGVRHTHGMLLGRGSSSDPSGSGDAIVGGLAIRTHRDGQISAGTVDFELLYYVRGWAASDDHYRFGLALRLMYRFGPVGLDIYVRADPGSGLELTLGPTLFIGR